jgi:rod shape-determining protein MreC
MTTDRKYAFFAVATLCVCILGLYVYRHRQGQTGRIDNLLISGAGGAQKIAFLLSKGFRHVLDEYLFLVNARRQSEELRKENDKLRSQLAALTDIELENGRLREALDFRARIEQRLVAAHVVAHDVSPDFSGIRIDKGLHQGVQVGMGVISPGGLVGRVLRAGPNYADVATLLDPTSNVDAIIQRSRARGVISGQSKQATCRMKYVDRLDDVVVGDVVVASGYGSIFPKGLLVGYVTAVVPNPNGILQNVTVKSAVDVHRIEEVFIVLPPTQPEEAT